MRIVKSSQALLGCTLLGLGAVSTALASDNTGVYVGTHIASATTDLGELSNVEGGSTSSTGMGYNLHIGYTIKPYIAVELGYIDMPQHDIGEVTLVHNQMQVKASTDAWAIYVAAKGNLHLNDHLSVYGKLGMASLTVTEQIDELGNTAYTRLKPLSDLGVAYRIQDNLSLSVGYSHIYGNYATSFENLGDYTQAYLGISYQF